MKSWKQLWCWLVGSRKTYFFPNTSIPIKERVFGELSIKLRTAGQRKWLDVYGAVIEVNQGPFRRPSAIYGGLSFWEVVGNALGDLGDKEWVSLRDQRGLPIGTALRLINTFPSLQGVIDRITELEHDLITERTTQKEWVAAVAALRRQIEDNRKRYRSPAVLDLLESIKKVLEDMEVTESQIDGDLVEQYLALFEGRQYWPSDR